MNNIDRRAALGIIGVGLPTVFLAACLGKEPSPPKPLEELKSPDMSRWPEITIPSTKTLSEVGQVPERHFPNIGMQELFIASHDTLPILAICALWKKEEAKGIISSKLRLDGRMGFQEIVSPFIPNVAPPVGSIRDGDASISEIRQFLEESLSQIDARKGGDLTNGKIPAVVRAMSRPREGSYAFVLGSNLIEYNGNPNQLSIVAIKFKFDPLRPLRTA